MQSLARELEARIAAGEAAVLVTLAGAEGSTPREAGARMLVTSGHSFGTIGGGQLEFHAIDVAREMLARAESARSLDLPLGPQLGQCCGGRVSIDFRRVGAEDIAGLRALEDEAAQRRPTILVYGAGHTGRALARALAPLPFRAILIDDREGVFGELPGTIDCRRLDDPETALRAAPAGAAHVILTHSHSLDYRLADAALRRGDAAYVGMIGSATKRALFERWFRAQGGAEEVLAGFTCPIGGSDVRDKRPEIIAALCVGELIRCLNAARMPATM